MDFTCSICLDDISRNVCHNCLRRVCGICVVIDNQTRYCSTKCRHNSILNDKKKKNFAFLWLQSYLIKDIANIVMSY